MATTDQQNALKDAMERAKQIAAKLAQQKQGGENSGGGDDTRKRSLFSPAIEPPAKRNPLEGITDPKLIAQQVANSLVQQSGVAGLGYNLVEEVEIPNKLVGLVIGRGGEMINKLQSESGAKVQVAPDPPPEMAAIIDTRKITITGSTESVEKAKALINEIRAGQKIPERLMVGTLPGEFSVEMMIGRGKVGLVIGKGGETIKSLQERAGCKMVLFQDGIYANAAEKPLRISGEQSTVMYGKQLVQDLLTSKELEGINEKQNYEELEVPRFAVGLVIGAKGANIQQMQAETGCKIQFKNEMDGATKTAMLTGNPQQLAAAKAKLMEIINSNANRGGGGSQGYNGAGGSQGWAPEGHKTMVIEVPPHKCGLVIGKGGETIKYIHSTAKVKLEMDRNTQDSQQMRIFNVSGTEEQIQNALDIIREKTNDHSITARPVGGGGAGGGGNAPPQQVRNSRWGPPQDNDAMQQHHQQQQQASQQHIPPWERQQQQQQQQQLEQRQIPPWERQQQQQQQPSHQQQQQHPYQQQQPRALSQQPPWIQQQQQQQQTQQQQGGWNRDPQQQQQQPSPHGAWNQNQTPQQARQQQQQQQQQQQPRPHEPQQQQQPPNPWDNQPREPWRQPNPNAPNPWSQQQQPQHAQQQQQQQQQHAQQQQQQQLPQQQQQHPQQPQHWPQQPHTATSQGHPGAPTSNNASTPTGAPQSAAEQPDYSAAWAEYYRQQQQQQQYGMQPQHGTPQSQSSGTPMSSANNAQAMAEYQAKLNEYYKSVGQHPPQ